jgi:hypothetical protein
MVVYRRNKTFVVKEGLFLRKRERRSGKESGHGPRQKIDVTGLDKKIGFGGV